MEVSATYAFDAPRQQVWELLIDPQVIAGCLPGCEAMEPTGDDTYRAILTIGIAAITGRYEGTVRMSDKNEPAGYTLVVEGKGKPGFVNGSAHVSLAEGRRRRPHERGGDREGAGRRHHRPRRPTTAGRRLEDDDGPLLRLPAGAR